MADNTVAITAGSGTSIRTITNTGIDGGAHQQVVSIGNPDGTTNGNDPDGTFATDDGPSNLLFEAFDGTLATQWTTSTVSSGTAPAQANGALTFSTATTVSQGSIITGINQLPMTSASYLQAAFVVQVDTASALANSTRWWGYGTNAATPSATAPVTNGAVFMLDYSAGAFYAAVYSAGTRTQTVTLTKPTDGAFHRYAIWYRTSRAYFVLDGVTVATIQFPNTAVSNNQFLIGGSVNYTTAPSAAPTMVWSSASAADGGDNNVWLSDATTPSVRAAVKKASTAAAATDTALVVGLHPSSGLPAGSQQLGWVGVGAVTPTSSFYTSTTTNAATVAKASAGSVQTLLITNSSASTQYVKLFNATSVTLGTTAAVCDLIIPATSNQTFALGTNGLRMPTGIAYTVTGGLGATNNTAGAGGVLVAMTFV